MTSEEHRKALKGDTLPTGKLIMKGSLQLSFQQQAATMQKSVDDRSNTETVDTIIGYLRQCQQETKAAAKQQMLWIYSWQMFTFSAGVKNIKHLPIYIRHQSGDHCDFQEAKMTKDSPDVIERHCWTYCQLYLQLCFD